VSANNPIEDNVARLISFIVRREEVRIHKEAGEDWPWTDDPILREYRFCNIRREDDAVTRWVVKNVREPYENDADLWHLLTMARLFNNVETLDAVLKNARAGHVLGVSFYESARSTVRRMQKSKQRVFNPAYMITTAGKKQDKIDYIFELLGTLWANRLHLRPQKHDTLNSYHMLLGQFQGLGSFLTAQVIADLKYVEPLRSANDWHTFAASGPGSRRGVNRILGRPVNASWQEDDWRQKLNKLQTATSVHLRRAKIELHAQDLQNCLCEFDKYERARLGKGKPKQRYRHG
jgi:hypothetical protein